MSIDRRAENTKSAKTVEIGMLLDFYGEILTDSQKNSLDLFYNQDLSLAEIAEQTGITRQGVRDRIVKGERVLRRTEEKLHLAARFGSNKRTIREVVSRLEQLHCEDADEMASIIALIRSLL